MVGVALWQTSPGALLPILKCEPFEPTAPPDRHMGRASLLQILIRYIDASNIKLQLDTIWLLGAIASAQEVFARQDFVGIALLILPSGFAGLHFLAPDT